ncbi:pituitary homeobox x-like [Mya arenaria]|nr:pituitary homeobox x-like [Mya arenaria]
MKKKKLVRTSYTNEQIQTLLKIFHENPYPDSEHMEDIAKEFGVPDNKIKIWFQNRRARWRRRVNDTINSYPHGFLPMTPALSPAHPNGYMTSGHLMVASTPQHLAASYFNPWMQTNSLSPDNNNANKFPVNPAQLRLSPTSTFTSGWSPTQSYRPVPVSAYSSIPTAYQMRTSPQHAMRSQFPSVTISPNSSSYLSSALLSHPMTSSNQMTTSQVNKTTYQCHGQSASISNGYATHTN